MSEQPEQISLDDVLITEELSRRSPRQPDLQAEIQAMRSLAQQLAQEPERMLQRLVELAVELCDAGTGGVSLVETQPNEEEVFRWVAMAGTLASCVLEVLVAREHDPLQAPGHRCIASRQSGYTPINSQRTLGYVSEYGDKP